MNKFCIMLGLLLGISLPYASAFAGISNAGVFDSMLQRFAHTAAGWNQQMVAYGSWLFWSLALLSMVWTYSLMLLKKADLQDLFAETIRFVTVTGFFYWLLINGPAIAIAIMDSLRQMASSASGLTKTVSPSGVVDVGFDIAFKVIDRTSIWSPANSTVGLLIAALILICLTLVSVNMLTLLISGWLLAYGAVFLLGFGGGRWTQDIAIHYYKTVLNVGLQIFTLILLVGIGQSFIDQYYAAMSDDMALKELFVMLVVAIILVTLVKTLPPKIASIVSGHHSGSSNLLGFGAAVGAAGLASAGAAYAGHALTGALAGGAGGASAINAAFQAAQQQMATTSISSGNVGLTGLTSGIGQAGQLVANMGSALAAGVSQRAADKMTAVKEACAERIADTMGGKLATAIKEASQSRSSGEPAAITIAQAPLAASNDQSLQDDIRGGSLSAGTGAPDALAPSDHPEVNAFINRPAYDSEARSS